MRSQQGTEDEVRQGHEGDRNEDASFRTFDSVDSLSTPAAETSETGRLPRVGSAALWDAVDSELRFACAKFGGFNSAHEGYAVILEELDELWLDIKRKGSTKDDMRKEAIQVAAMAIRFCVDICGDEQ